MLGNVRVCLCAYHFPNCLIIATMELPDGLSLSERDVNSYLSQKEPNSNHGAEDEVNVA